MQLLQIKNIVKNALKIVLIVQSINCKMEVSRLFVHNVLLAILNPSLVDVLPVGRLILLLDAQYVIQI